MLSSLTSRLQKGFCTQTRYGRSAGTNFSSHLKFWRFDPHMTHHATFGLQVSSCLSYWEATILSEARPIMQFLRMCVMATLHSGHDTGTAFHMNPRISCGAWWKWIQRIVPPPKKPCLMLGSRPTMQPCQPIWLRMWPQFERGCTKVQSGRQYRSCCPEASAAAVERQAVENMLMTHNLIEKGRGYLDKIVLYCGTRERHRECVSVLVRSHTWHLFFLIGSRSW